MEKIEPNAMKSGRLTKRIEPDDKKDQRSVRFGQEECNKFEREVMMARACKDDQFIRCFDDITRQELPWYAVKQAPELELKYLRDHGVYEKVDEREAIAKYQLPTVDTKWIDTDKALEAEPLQVRSRIMARKFKS